MWSLGPTSSHPRRHLDPLDALLYLQSTSRISQYTYFTTLYRQPPQLGTRASRAVHTYAAARCRAALSERVVASDTCCATRCCAMLRCARDGNSVGHFIFRWDSKVSNFSLKPKYRTLREWVSRFLTAHQHIIGHFSAIKVSNQITSTFA